MTSKGLEASSAQHRDRNAAHPRRTLTQFLDDEELTVLDVVRGAPSGSRRLYVGHRGERKASYAIGVPRGPAFDSVVGNEARLLGELADTLPAELAATIPRPVEELAGPASPTALVVTAVPGVGERPLEVTRTTLQAVVRWLTRLWASTEGDRIHTGLGRAQLDVLLGRAREPSRLEDVVLPLLAAQQRLAGVTVATTPAHGCLCPRHTHVEGDTVVGVDDWALGSSRSDPLRDLGRFFVTVVGDELPRVLDGASDRAHVVRELLGEALEAVSVSPDAWRDVLLLAQLELALERPTGTHPPGVVVLRRAAESLPAR